jgi:hypothetical protein
MEKKETLKEAFQRAVKSGLFKDETFFVAGAKWQAERSYSEEEVLDFNLKYLQELGKHQSESGKWVNFKIFFEQLINQNNEKAQNQSP